ncbi:MAG: epoxyqueuosine reductase QueH [Bacteroidales bacterium]|nr:epoxyqueuosine reductase QueH [Bacteroidales bacterium]
MDLCGAPLVKLTPPAEGKILLHACCAPCSSAILECMVLGGLRPTVFFSNSNITPREEYDKRKAEIIRYCESLGIEWVDDDYDHDDWLVRVAAGREDAPERGPRCLECFRYRLARAAAYASKHGFAVLTTTLASSRWKSLEQVGAAGAEACASVSSGAGTNSGAGSPVVWWDMNWRKGGLQPRRAELIRELGFYNQTFCGCEYSKEQ